jgi:hypothetical protein
VTYDAFAAKIDEMVAHHRAEIRRMEDEDDVTMVTHMLRLETTLLELTKQVAFDFADNGEIFEG